MQSIKLAHGLEEQIVPREVLDLPNGPREQCYEAWADKLSGFADRRLVGGTPLAQAWKYTGWTVDTLSIIETTAGAEEINRRPEHVRRSFCECVALHLPLHINPGGQLYGIIDDDVMSMRADEIHIHDLNVPTRFATPDTLLTLSVFVPYTAIGYDPSAHPTAMSVSVTTPIGQLLNSAMRTLHHQATDLQRSDAPALATGFGGLVRGLLLQEKADEQARASIASSRLHLIKGYIEEHIKDPGLSATQLCRKFGASRATMYRMFESEGGIASYLTERRLVHAFRELRSTPATRGLVKIVAGEFGFDDHSHFNRLFKNRFRITPSDASGLWAEEQEKHNRLQGRQACTAS